LAWMAIARARVIYGCCAGVRRKRVTPLSSRAQFALALVQLRSKRDPHMKCAARSRIRVRMTIVGVVSDTHLPSFGRALPRELERGLRDAGVSRILHMGDMTQLLCVELFEHIAPFDGVAGNNDGDDLRARFGRKKILTIEDVRVGLVHGDGKLGNALTNATAAFRPKDVDVVCFGHSHRPMHERYDSGVLFFNPGSPTDKRVNPRYSYGIMRVDGAQLDLQLHYYTDRSTD